VKQKEKQEEMRREVLADKESKEMSHCSFQPNILASQRKCSVSPPHSTESQRGQAVRDK